jgi:hypothetical protein
MQSLFAKPLTLLLILMLLPLQSVMAVSPGVAASVPQTECMHEGDMRVTWGWLPMMTL